MLEEEQYTHVKNMFATMVGSLTVEGEDITARVQMVGTATTFYSENLNRPVGHHYDKLSSVGYRSDMEIEIFSPELTEYMVLVEAPVNKGIIRNGMYDVFKNSPAEKGFYYYFPEVAQFTRKLRREFKRDVDIKLKIDITPIKDIEPPETGPIELFRKEYI